MTKKKFLTTKKKFPIIIATFVLLLFVTGYACMEELHDSLVDRDEASAIEYAKNWYEMHKPDELSLRSAGGKQKVQMKPEWDHAFSNKNEKYEMVETDLTTWGMFSITMPECMEKFNETGNERYRQSYTRIVFRTDRKTNETVGFLMTFVPNVEWFKKAILSRLKQRVTLIAGKISAVGSCFIIWMAVFPMDGSMRMEKSQAGSIIWNLKRLNSLFARETVII